MTARTFGDVLDEAEGLMSSVPAWTPLLRRLLERDRELLAEHGDMHTLLRHGDRRVATNALLKAEVLDGQVSRAWAMWQQLIEDWGTW